MRFPVYRPRSLSRSRALAGAVLLAAAAVALPACGGEAAGGAKGPRVIVLGFDGMDYSLTQEMLARGELPHLARLAEMGIFQPLETSVPPQSPVAWSNFITGMDAGGHGIFDFIHREPESLLPYLSTSRTDDAGSSLKLGKYQFPLSGGKVELLRRGEAFWEVLDRHGVETSIIRIPANFPPSGSATRELSGMGTPDITGSYGEFSYYTSDAYTFAGQDPSGGDIHVVYVSNNRVAGTLYGPDNPFLIKEKLAKRSDLKVTADFVVHIDPVEPVAKIVVGHEERILKVGEWSDWVPVDLEFIPTQGVRVICRFFLKSVRPEFALYVTPLNFDPLEPAMPISTPEGYATELAEVTGRYYTQGMPEDTHALRGGILDRAEFLAQAKLTGDEIIEQYKYVLDQFDDGLLFYYFGNLDQVSHMLWRPMDPDHPSYDPEADPPFADAVPSVYRSMDGVVGHTLDRIDDDTLLIVMSDHGFTSMRRSFNLNTWLKENGYLTVDPSFKGRAPGLFTGGVVWSRTQAYGLGINGLYVNLEGREKRGIVRLEERDALLDEISEKLLAVVDPTTGKQAITRIYRTDEYFKDRGQLHVGPDIIVGYTKMTRGSDQGALGELEPEVIRDVTSHWTGCHLMDHTTVPGVLFTNRPLKRPAVALQDLAASILYEYGIEGFPARAGEN